MPGPIPWPLPPALGNALLQRVIELSQLLFGPLPLAFALLELAGHVVEGAAEPADFAVVLGDPGTRRIIALAPVIFTQLGEGARQLPNQLMAALVSARPGLIEEALGLLQAPALESLLSLPQC